MSLLEQEELDGETTRRERRLARILRFSDGSKRVERDLRVASAVLSVIMGQIMVGRRRVTKERARML